MREFESMIQDNEKDWNIMMVRGKEQSVEVFTFPTTFHMESVDSNPFHGLHLAIFWLAPSNLFMQYPHYGVNMEWTIP